MTDRAMADRSQQRAGPPLRFPGWIPVLAALLFGLPTTAAGQARAACATAGAIAEEGWQFYRTGDVDAAAKRFDRAWEMCRDHAGALAGQGYVALRRDDTSEAARLFDLVLTKDPTHVDALLGAGLSKSRLGQLAAAEVHFRAAMRHAPGSQDATLGLARTLAWQGRHDEAEALYRASVSRWPASAEAHLGLVRALEAQGRARAAHRALEDARRSAPATAEIRSFANDLARSRRPSFSTSFVYESDSDRNRVRSTVLRAGWQPQAGVELRWDAYLRESKVDRQFFLVRRAAGLHMGLATTLDTGWQMRAGLGGSNTNVSGAGTTAAFDASFSTPRRHPVVALLSFSRAPLDATSVLIERGVEVSSVTLVAHAPGASFGDARLSVSYAGYEGIGSNQRWYSNLRLLASPTGPVRVGLDVTLLGFSDDLNEGYFDPPFYGLAVVPVEGRISWRERWSLHATVSPGVEHIGGGAGQRGALKGEGELSYSIPGGARIAVGGVYATTGAQALWADEFSYRYVATTVGLSWQF